MRISEFKPLIANMPVDRHAFTSKLSTWKLVESVDATFKSIFGASPRVTLSRGDLRQLARKANLSEFIVGTILWGYPNGMRGNHFLNIIADFDAVKRLLASARQIDDWQAHSEGLKLIRGLGLSTYTKLLQFLPAVVQQFNALILDQRIIDVVQQNVFDELEPLHGLSSDNAAKRYPEYLKCMATISAELEVPTENIEFFLFEFGLHLKEQEGRRD